MKMYPGWVMVGITMAISTLALGFTVNIFGLFVLPVSEDLDLSRADTNTAVILLSIGMALCAPFVGRILDSAPLKRVMLVCALLFGGSLIALGLSPSLQLSAFILFVPLPIGVIGAGIVSGNALVARWFKRHRGRALAIATVGMSLGGVLFAAPVAVLIEAIGWRQTLIVLGVISLVLLLAMNFFIRGEPSAADLEPEALPAEHAQAAVEMGKPLKAVQIAARLEFWLIAVSVAGSMGVAQALAVSMTPIAQGNGVGAAQAGSLLAVIAAMGIVSKFVVAGIADKFDRKLLIACSFVVLACINGALVFSDTFTSLLICCAAMGLMLGGTTPLFYALLADRFGPASFGTSSGLATPVASIVAAITTRYAGEVFDRTGGYDLMFMTFAGVLVLSALMMLSSRLLGRAPQVAPSAA